MRRGGTWIQRWRVPLGFLCAAVFLLLAKPTRTALVIGACVSLIGLAIRAWAAGYIRKNDELAVFGPTEWWRNGSPYSDDICVERTDIDCRVDCHRRACSKWICMDILVGRVFEAVARRIVS